MDQGELTINPSRTSGVTRRAAVALPILLLLGACGQSDDEVKTSGAPSAPPEGSAPGSAGRQYSTTAFSVPFTIMVESVLKSPPDPDSPNLLSWQAAASADEAVRFLVPVEVYAPGSSTPQPPPSDYLAYLRGQAAQGADFLNVSAITVDGRSGTLMTATTQSALEGSLGCPVAGADPADGCFGLQPDLSLRIAVIEIDGGTTLLAWARTGRAAPDVGFVAMFERMLASVRFE